MAAATGTGRTFQCGDAGEDFRASPKAAKGEWCSSWLLSPTPVEGKLGLVEERVFLRL